MSVETHSKLVNFIWNQLVTKVETAIDRLQEYRTALVTAAVTGKIDVRGTYALPEKP